MTTPQAPIPGVPAGSSTPSAYITAAAASTWLQSEFGLTVTLSNGHVLAASMALDEEAPFFGVKVDPTQDRSWPRTFKYGWPNIIASPSAVMSSTQLPGAFFLDYEAVVPWQVVDWVCLEAYRLVTLPLTRGISSESVTGASVHYDNAPMLSMLDRLQAQLLSPFLMRQGHTHPFPTGLV